MTSKARNLPDAVKLAIYRWHVEHLKAVQDVKRDGLNDTGALQSVAEGFIGNSQPIGEPQALPAANTVQNVKQNAPTRFANDDRDKMIMGKSILPLALPTKAKPNAPQSCWKAT